MNTNNNDNDNNNNSTSNSTSNSNSNSTNPTRKDGSGVTRINEEVIEVMNGCICCTVFLLLL